MGVVGSHFEDAILHVLASFGQGTVQVQSRGQHDGRTDEPTIATQGMLLSRPHTPCGSAHTECVVCKNGCVGREIDYLKSARQLRKERHPASPRINSMKRTVIVVAALLASWTPGRAELVDLQILHREPYAGGQA